MNADATLNLLHITPNFRTVAISVKVNVAFVNFFLRIL